MTQRNQMIRRILTAAALAAVASQAVAQAAPQGGAMMQVAQGGDSRCRKDVKDYLDTLRLLRETGGTHVGDMVAGGIMSESQVDKLVQAQGHCAAAQLLREKQTRR